MRHPSLARPANMTPLPAATLSLWGRGLVERTGWGLGKVIHVVEGFSQVPRKVGSAARLGCGRHLGSNTLRQTETPMKTFLLALPLAAAALFVNVTPASAHQPVPVVVPVYSSGHHHVHYDVMYRTCPRDPWVF